MTGRTQLSYLDLGALYQHAKNCYSGCFSRPMHDLPEEYRLTIRGLANDLAWVIDAIRNDGLDPHWNPERDALVGMTIPCGFSDVCGYSTTFTVSPDGADHFVKVLHERGYKIVKDEA